MEDHKTKGEERKNELKKKLEDAKGKLDIKKVKYLNMHIINDAFE